MQTTTQTTTKRRAPGPDSPELLVAAEPKTAKASAPRLPSGPKAEREPKAPKPLLPCLCGCGVLVERRFKQGHDARAKGVLQRAHAGCAHPQDASLATMAKAARAHGLEPKGETAEALAVAFSTEKVDWFETFVLAWARPGTRKAAPAQTAAA